MADDWSLCRSACLVRTRFLILLAAATLALAFGLALAFMRRPCCQ